MCPTRGETAAFVPKTGARCRFCVQYGMIATPREASGSASGGRTTIFAGGSSPVSGITDVTPQPSFGVCANTVVAGKKTAATARRDIEVVC
jgi:hypothetical protein